MGGIVGVVGGRRRGWGGMCRCDGGGVICSVDGVEFLERVVWISDVTGGIDGWGGVF